MLSKSLPRSTKVDHHMISIVKQQEVPALMKNMGKAKRIVLTAGLIPVLILQQICAQFSSTPAQLFFWSTLLLFLGVVMLLPTWRLEKPSYLDWALAAYLATIWLSLLFLPVRAFALVRSYPATGVYLCLFAAAFFPPAFGKEPFTCRYARRSTPVDRWKSPLFMKINLMMTFVWAGIFAASFVLSLYPSPWMQTIAPLFVMLGFGLPFNARFPDLYLQWLGLPSLAEQRRAKPEEDRSGLLDGPCSPSGLLSRKEEPLPLREPLEVPLKQRTLREEKEMKVLALNSSPRSEGRSKTEVMLRYLVKGMREAGADVEVVHLREKKVKDCVGCFTCWTKSPGVCIQKDDMTIDLFPKWTESDLVVYASPLYHFTVNATMKTFIERTLPVFEPFFEERQGSTAHPLRRKHPAIVMLSVAGFPEDSVFAELGSWANRVFNRNLAAEIYRPAAEAMMTPAFAHKAKDILEATAQAGREIIESKKVSPETMARIKKPIHDDTGAFLKMGNLMWRTCIAEGLTPSELAEKRIMPRPDSIDTFLTLMLMGFNPEGAGDTRAVLQFDLSGEVEGSCYLNIENGSIQAFEGPADHPSLTVQSPFPIWMDIVTGRADGQEMFMQQKYKVLGDFSLLLKMKDFFGK